MHDLTDAELLEQHRRGSGEAFTALVRRHIDWVWSVARRRLGDSHLAEDVTQAVFVTLARKPPRLWRGSPLSPWLLKVVNLTCLSTMRRESNRLRRETEAARMKSLSTTPEPSASWGDVAPHLDELVERLPSRNRTIILLRFYEQKSFAEIAEMIGITEDAARKRVSRSVEALRGMLSGRGVSMPAAALTAAVLSSAVKSAPASLLAAATQSAGPAGATGSVAALANEVISMMTQMKIKLAMAILGAAVLMTGGSAIIVSLAMAQPSTPPMPVAVPATNPAKDDANASLLHSLVSENTRSLNRIEVARYSVMVDSYNAALARQSPPATASLLKSGNRSWSEYSFSTMGRDPKEDRRNTIRAFQNTEGAGVWAVDTAQASYAEKDGGGLPTNFEALRTAEPQPDLMTVAFGDERERLQSVMDKWSAVKEARLVPERGRDGLFTISVFTSRRTDGPSVVFTLDGSRGFLVTAVDAFYPSGRAADSSRTTITAIGPDGIWFPTRYEKTHFPDEDGPKATRKSTIVASNIILNGPVRDEEFDFSSLRLPDETKITRLKADGTKQIMLAFEGGMLDMDVFMALKFAQRDNASNADKPEAVMPRAATRPAATVR